ncbi:MAG: DNA polymerase III subunit beta [Chitinophagaceae bacterium]|nr:MAG: DNA polymerase III subunit beta [Chitinophagaceae bacterium]
MNFVASSNSLLKQLQSINGVVASNNLLPILEDFLFNLQDGKLHLTATDIDTSMSTEINVESKSNGKIAIPAKMLLEILKSLPEQPVNFNIDEESFSVELKSEYGKYKLAGENGDDFPKIPVEDDVKEIEISAETLFRGLTSTQLAVSDDELRPAMTGILFQIDENGLTMVSTDAHKLVRFRKTDIKTDKPAQFILPKKAAQLLRNNLTGEDSVVRVAFNNKHAFFTFKSMQIICRLIDAKFPDYNSVIPVENPFKMLIEKKDLTGSLKRVMIFSNKSTNQVSLKISGNNLKISGQDIEFYNEAQESLTCNYEGEDIEIGFNAKFLSEMLGVLETDQVSFNLSAPNRAALLFPDKQQENEDILMLIMPLMIRS